MNFEDNNVTDEQKNRLSQYCIAAALGVPAAEYFWFTICFQNRLKLIQTPDNNADTTMIVKLHFYLVAVHSLSDSFSEHLINIEGINITSETRKILQ